MSAIPEEPHQSTPDDSLPPTATATSTSASTSASTSTEEAPTPTPAEDSGSSRSRQGVWALLRRLHFYAGVFVAPFLFLAALTGLAYTLTPQLDQLVYGDKLHVARVVGQPHPLADQVAAARAAYSEGSLAYVVTPPTAEDTTRVVLNVPGLENDRQRTVFVDPYTNEVKGDLTTWFDETPLTTWFDDLHRNLHLGETGRLYSEVAASWLWVLVLGGLALWLGRARGQRARTMRGVLVPDRSARGVRRTRSWHAVTGVWLSVGLLGLSATGLTWSHYAGERFGSLLDAVHAHAPALDTSLDSKEPNGGSAKAGGEHTGHGTAHEAGHGEASGFDVSLAAARDAGLGGSLTLTPPAEPGNAWSVAQDDRVWPVHLDQMAVDTRTGDVTAHNKWSDYPLLAKLSKLGVAAHMGVLFGIANQIALALVAIGLILGLTWGYRMWWLRRPTRGDRRAAFGRAPARGVWRQLPLPVLLLGIPATIALGWALPVLGVTLLGFLVMDVLTGVVQRRRHA
ncbi:PepSY-associated TM helix domain-containing protein [Streptomyces sp. NPDC086787]|uniref:PepSY-associated TM helix domain-containing protein n=1 Tax=Streptomyces sp. NPDC086787 TaxID=3365759 RepID=UPI00380A9E9A